MSCSAPGAAAAIDPSSSSRYPMISVEEALARVLREVGRGISASRRKISLQNCRGFVTAEDIFSTVSIPEFPTSIMDGYAVHAPIAPGEYVLEGSVRAGSDFNAKLDEGCVRYITTGARLPPGSNAVVKIEDTTRQGLDGRVRILAAAQPGDFVRQIASDMARGDLVLPRGQLIGAAEVALLCAVGATDVMCVAPPTVGVMSTGDELINAWDTPVGTQIRDSNRAALIAALEEEGIAVLDLGIVPDNKELIRDRMLRASAECDVVIASGGVSMGDKDFVKPLLEELGTVHFGRLNMKPGKPTTFASIPKPPSSSAPHSDPAPRCLFFGLPGNPVSCLVTLSLLVLPAVRCLRGLPPAQSLHTEARARLVGPRDLKLDPERFEYHRGIAEFHMERSGGWLQVRSTGEQRSSRLLSMRSANALIVLPQGSGVVPVGSFVTVLLTGPVLPTPFSAPSSASASASAPTFSVHPLAVEAAYHPSSSSSQAQAAPQVLPVEYVSITAAAPPASVPAYALSPSPAVTTGANSAGGSEVTKPKEATALPVVKKPFRVGLLTISDRASAGVYADESGPEMARVLAALSAEPAWPLSCYATASSSPSGSPSAPLGEREGGVVSAIVPDDAEHISSQIKAWCDGGDACDVILTSGGTGFGPRDLTPEAVKPLLHREAPAVAQALINEGLKHTPLAVLSRPVVGTRHNTLICTLPGSVKATRENMAALRPLLPRIVELLRTGQCLAPSAAAAADGGHAHSHSHGSSNS